MISRRVLAARVVKTLGVTDIRDVFEAFNMIVTSLSTILRSTETRELLTLIEKTSFAPIGLLRSLSDEELSSLEKILIERARSLTEREILRTQEEAPRLLDHDERKKLAAYYTKPAGLRLMGHLTLHYAETHSRSLVISDPFMGSGLTLSEALRDLPQSLIDRILGIEYHVLPALVGYAAIVHYLGGRYEKVDVLVGDSFKIISNMFSSLLRYSSQKEFLPKADVILTNPPFTRWELLGKEYREFLARFIEKLGYGKYVKRRQLGLQVVSLFLIDHLLKGGGLLVSVLPASTFYTIYGEAVKELLKDRYSVDAIIELGSKTSFSIDSGFKELILVARKTREESETAFLTIMGESGKIIEDIVGILRRREKASDDTINWVDLTRIQYPWNLNWLSLFGKNPLREFLSKIFEHGGKKNLLVTWEKGLKARIVRGVEMYGPNFFFIPNRHWRIVEKGSDAVVIEGSGGTKLKIDNAFLVPALRKPELYAYYMVPKVGHYFISIPHVDEKELPLDVARYIEWGERSSAADHAVGVFGRYWYSHVYGQLASKRPFGRVFLPDKIDSTFRNRGVFACYSDQPLTASKNFYIVTTGDRLKDKTLTLWFNSSIFIAYFIVASRKISERWARFLEEDYLRMPVLNVDRLNKQDLEELAKLFDKMAGIKTKPLMPQLYEGFRLEIDTTLLSILGAEDLSTAIQLHSLLKNILL